MMMENFKRAKKYKARSPISFISSINKLGRHTLKTLELNPLILKLDPEDIFVLIDGLSALQNYKHNEVKDTLLIKLKSLQLLSLKERMKNNTKIFPNAAKTARQFPLDGLTL